jgi:hypothetical protein
MEVIFIQKAGEETLTFILYNEWEHRTVKMYWDERCNLFLAVKDPSQCTMPLFIYIASFFFSSIEFTVRPRHDMVLHVMLKFTHKNFTLQVCTHALPDYLRVRCQSQTK